MLTLPSIPNISDSDLDDAKERRRIMSYLYKLDEQLRYMLTHLGYENFAGDVQQAIQGSASMEMINDVTGNLQRMSTTIAQTAGEIALKADQSEVDALGQDVSSLSSEISLVPGQITSAVTAIQVGGRNLIRNSELIEMPAGTSGFTNTELYRGFEPGKTYTLSIGEIVQTSGTTQNYLHVAVNSTLGNTPQTTDIFHVGTERMWWTFTVPEDDLTYRLIMYNGMGAHAENKAYELHEAQLEIGNKATAWTPAPEDTEDEITATRSMITQTASEIRAEVSDIDSTLSGMDNLYSTGDSVSGYLTNVGGIAGGGTSLTETTSDYIAVTPGETLTFQCWVTPETGSSNYLWMAYGFYNSSKTWLSSPGRTAETQGAGTGTAQYRYITFTVPDSAAYIRISGRMYADGRMKLERNAEPTPYRDAAGEVANTSMTLNKNGFFVTTSGTVQIDAADPAKKGRIALGELMSLDYTGGLQAKDGSFANSLKVNGKQVMTAAEITAPIKVATTQPSGHGFLWVKPTSVTSASYSAYSAGSRDSTVHFGATNPITRSFTADTTATLANATFTYTLDFDVYCLTDLAQITNVKFTAVATKGSASVSFGASAAMTMTKYTLAHVTLTASSSTNLCTNSNAISVAITASASSLTKLFIQSDQYMTLKISNQAGTGTQTCSVYYVN